MNMDVGNKKWAEIIYNSIRVDPELRPERCKRTLHLKDSTIIAYFFFFFNFEISQRIVFEN